MNVHIRIAIADDHPMVVQGIQNMLQHYEYLHVEDVYADGTALMAGLAQRQPHVLLLDIRMPGQNDGDLVPQICEKWPAVSILMITTEEHPEQVHKMMENGALGYLLKNTDQQTLAEAIVQVNAGKQFLDTQLKEPLLAHVLNEKQRLALKPLLSRREKEMLTLIVQGNTTKEIAATLFIGQRTAEIYRYNLMVKLGVKNAADLVRKALEEKLLE